MTTADHAKVLRAATALREHTLPPAAALELIATGLGYTDFKTACSTLDHKQETPQDRVRFVEAVPILRIFDEAKAREFYIGFLGFEAGFEHRFEPDLPLYMEVARAGLRLHLSGHHGDATPGSTVFIPMRGVHAFHKELTDRKYGHARPGIEKEPWGDVLEVTDPFGNRLRFCERPGV